MSKKRYMSSNDSYNNEEYDVSALDGLNFDFGPESERNNYNIEMDKPEKKERKSDFADELMKRASGTRGPSFGSGKRYAPNAITREEVLGNFKASEDEKEKQTESRRNFSSIEMNANKPKYSNEARLIFERAQHSSSENKDEKIGLKFNGGSSKEGGFTVKEEEIREQAPKTADRPDIPEKGEESSFDFSSFDKIFAQISKENQDKSNALNDNKGFSDKKRLDVERFTKDSTAADDTQQEKNVLDNKAELETDKKTTQENTKPDNGRKAPFYYSANNASKFNADDWSIEDQTDGQADDELFGEEHEQKAPDKIPADDSTTVFNPIRTDGEAPALDKTVMFEPADDPHNTYESDYLEDRRSKSENFVVESQDNDGSFFDDSPSYFDEENDEYEEIEDYNGIGDAEAIRTDLEKRRHTLSSRITFTAIISALLFVLSSSSSFIPKTGIYYLIITALLAVVLLINFNTTRSIGQIFTGHPDNDTACTLAVLGAMAQSVMMYFSPSADGIGYANIVAGIASLSMMFNAVGKRSMVKRVVNNFKMIANEDIKLASTFIKPPVSEKIVGSAVTGGSLIFAQRKTVNLKHFLKNSFSSDLYESISGKMVYFSLIAATAAGVALYFLKGDINFLGFGIASVLCLFAPFASMLLSNFAFSGACKRLRAKGAVLTGYSAVDEINESNVLTLNATDLFPGENMKLYNIKTFGDQAIDSAISDAAAVLIESDGPVADIFDRMIEGRHDMLPEVDSVIYEEKMGLTGWVGGRKTIVGNRMIMEAHGIAVPPFDVDKKILQSGKFPVYLASDGRLSALFVVGYEINQELADSLRELVNTGTTLVVRSCDPNITQNMVADYYGIWPESVSIMSDFSANVFVDATRPTVDEEAILSQRDASGFVSGFVSALKLHANIKVATVLNVIFIILGVALFTVAAVMDMYTYLSVGVIALYSVISLIITLSVHIFRRA